MWFHAHRLIPEERYFITFTDIASCSSFVLPMENRGQVAGNLCKAFQYIQWQTGKIPQMVYPENSAQYVIGAIKNIMLETGGEFRTKNPYNLEENGIADRLNSTILNCVRSVLYTAKMDNRYCPFAACDLFFNQILLMHISTGKCPYDEWTGTMPEVKTC